MRPFRLTVAVLMMISSASRPVVGCIARISSMVWPVQGLPPVALVAATTPPAVVAPAP
jgi:hypothetical protein